VPAKVIEKVKMHTLDLLGAALVGTDLSSVRAVRDYSLEFGGRGRSRLIGARADTLDAEYAALANATAGHAWDLDDYHIATGHPGCVAVPTCVAVAEERSASGAEYLLAATVAFEIASRVGVSASFSTAVDRGFHSTSAYGVFGAAAGAGRLLDLSHTHFANALAIAGSHASGLSEAVSAGGQGRLHAGIGSAGGIRSARMAGMGLTGPPTIFEGARGYLQAFSAHPKAELLTKGLGDSWALMGSRLKPYPCAANILSPIAALQDILSANTIHPADIKEIHVGVERLAPYLAAGAEPKDMTQAKFSTPFTLAMTAVKRRNDLTAYREAERDGFRDPEILRIARLVECHLDPECEAAYPDQWMSKVVLVTNDRKSLEAKASGPLDMAKPAVAAKFRDLLAHIVPSARIDAILDAVSSLEEIREIGQLSGLLVTLGSESC
jgi:2-methylcitrate dehydratase PrpD